MTKVFCIEYLSVEHSSMYLLIMHLCFFLQGNCIFLPSICISEVIKPIKT